MRQPSWQEQEHFLYPVQKGSQQGPATFVSIQEHSADLFTPRSMLEHIIKSKMHYINTFSFNKTTSFQIIYVLLLLTSVACQ